tara:strand:+ start:353 stop:589 length:237 start_codon:yes stop_codon:yes gene_type:complete
MLQGIIIKEATKFIAKQFKLDKVLDYVEGENELDMKVKHMEEKIKLLEKMAHPSRDFEICGDCRCKVVVAEHIEERTK